MLIDTEVEITLCAGNIEYYENKGYNIPRSYNKYGKLTVPKGTKATVKVEDLPLHSMVLVKVQCDICEKNYTIAYANYNRWNHDGHIYCRHCSKSVLNRGENHYAWKSDMSDEERQLKRKIDGYDEFIRMVLKRDNYTCQHCGSFSDELNVHHLNGYNWCKEGRLDPNNAITLCDNCHSNFHSHYGKGNNTKEQFEEWTGKTINICQIFNITLSPTRQIYCIEENKVYDGVKHISKEWNVTSLSYIYDVCNHTLKHRKINGVDKPYVHYTVKGKHLLWYDEYINMSSSEVLEYLLNGMGDAIVCITTNQLFSSMAKVKLHYNVDSSHLSDCCNNKRKHAGRLFDGTRLEWMYYNDFKDCHKNISINDLQFVI